MRIEAESTDVVDTNGQRIEDHLVADGDGERLEVRAEHETSADGSIRERIDVQRTTEDGQTIREVSETIVDAEGNGETLSTTTTHAGRKIFAKVTIGLGVCLGVAAAIAFFATRRAGEASLMIVTEPVHAVEVTIDGKAVGVSTPVHLRGMTLGLHTIELRTEGYHPYTQTVQLTEAKSHTMVVPLEPIRP